MSQSMREFNVPVGIHSIHASYFGTLKQTALLLHGGVLQRRKISFRFVSI